MPSLGNWLSAIWISVFPERDDHALVRQASEGDVLRLLAPTDRGRFVALLPFREPLVRALVHEAKFRQNEAAWHLLAAALAQYLKHCESGSVVIPIPLSAARERQRGYNQAREIAKRALRELPQLKLQTSALYRTRDTAPQTSLGRRERLENMSGAFAALAGGGLAGRSVIVVDDVATTGATLEAAREALLPLRPAAITLLALAH